jgi:hypothetical protein
MTHNQLKKFLATGRWNGVLFMALPQIILLVVVVGLLVWMVQTSVKSTKGSLNTAALKKQLMQLQSKFLRSEAINPDRERAQMEMLQNKIKTTSEQLTISDDNDLKQLFDTNCNYIIAAMNNAGLEERSSWIKLKELMLDFDALYFRRA